MTKNLPASIIHSKTEDDVKTVLDDYMEWLPKYNEHAQGRTNFQIEKFIGYEDGTPANNYINILYQTRVMRGELIREVKEAVELQRNFEYKWKDNDGSEPIHTVDEFGNDKYAWKDLEEMWFKHRLEEVKMSLKDKLSQLETMNAMLETLEKNNGGEITRAQVEEEAPAYWEARFERQMVDSIIGQRLGISTGDIKSVRQAAAPTLVPGSRNQISEDSFASKLVKGHITPDVAHALGNERTIALYDRQSKPGFESARFDEVAYLPFNIDVSPDQEHISLLENQQKEIEEKLGERKSIHSQKATKIEAPKAEPTSKIDNKYGIDKDQLSKLGIKVSSD